MSAVELLQEALDTQYEAGRLAARKIDTQAATLARVAALANKWEAHGLPPGSHALVAAAELRAALGGDGDA